MFKTFAKGSKLSRFHSSLKKVVPNEQNQKKEVRPSFFFFKLNSEKDEDKKKKNPPPHASAQNYVCPYCTISAFFCRETT